MELKKIFPGPNGFLADFFFQIFLDVIKDDIMAPKSFIKKGCYCQVSISSSNQVTKGCRAKKIRQYSLVCLLNVSFEKNH
jgi:hypothetical protein